MKANQLSQATRCFKQWFDSITIWNLNVLTTVSSVTSGNNEFSDSIKIFQRIEEKTQTTQKKTLTIFLWAGDVDEMIECLPSMPEAVSLITAPHKLHHKLAIQTLEIWNREIR